MAKAVTIVEHPMGLHAAPAAMFVATASAFQSEITVRNLNARSHAVDGKDVLDILTLAITQGTTIEIEAAGKDERDAIRALVALIEQDFNQP